MIEQLPNSQGNILGLRASGKLTDEDYEDVLVPGIEAIIKEHGKIRFLFYLDDGFDGWEPGAMWEDFKLGFGDIRKECEKLALVGGPDWVEWAMKLSSHLIHGEVKTFDVDQLQAAWDWIED
jgi:hypothetical protein